MTASVLPHGIQPPPAHASMPRFHLLLIGDELLSGRRQDKHVPHTIQTLAERGLTLSSVRIVGDGRADIVAALRDVLACGDVVFSCGGIGATPDDQTRQAAAEALGVELALHPEGAVLIEQRFRQLAEQRGVPYNPTDAEHQQRLQMAMFPTGCQIVPNPYNQIAGFSVGHVHFYPGFPAMAWPMMAWTLDQYYARWFDQREWAERSLLACKASEAKITPLLEAIEARYPQVKVFSLPTLQHPVHGPHIDLGVKGAPDQVPAAFADMEQGLRELGIQLVYPEATDPA